jgi:hypothetical protein
MSFIFHVSRRHPATDHSYSSPSLLQKLHVQHTLTDGATGKHFYDSCIDIMGFFEEFVPVGWQDNGRSLRLQMFCCAKDFYCFMTSYRHFLVVADISAG